jgi:ketosteroid isomerase-like protein
MNRRTMIETSLAAGLAAWCARSVSAQQPEPPSAGTNLEQQVADAERAFAKTMADRDHAAFTGWVAEDAVFFGSTTISRGREAVAAAWKPYFSRPAAPFSWRPERVQVLESGALAFSTGPIFDADGKRFGTFNSVWRRERDGAWRIVFDSGCPPCECP